MGRSLTVLVQQTNAYRAARTLSAAQIARALETVAQMAGRVLGDLEDVISGLDAAEVRDLGLCDALHMLALRIERRYGLKVALDLPASPLYAGWAPSLKCALAAYRIAQEALHNAGQHAGAARVGVSTRPVADWLQLVIADDGAGFHPPEPLDGLSGNGQWGLAEMVERKATEESARIALSYVRAKANGLEIPPDFFEGKDIHLHVPTGATPKDGPSAGVAMVTALVSLLMGRSVRADVGMTGEITLQGQVLPIGGTKQKVLAAHRAGLKTVVVPQRNEADLDDVPEDVREEMTFVLAETIDQVLEAGLEKASEAELAKAA